MISYWSTINYISSTVLPRRTLASVIKYPRQTTYACVQVTNPSSSCRNYDWNKQGSQLVFLQSNRVFIVRMCQFPMHSKHFLVFVFVFNNDEIKSLNLNKVVISAQSTICCPDLNSSLNPRQFSYLNLRNLKSNCDM